MKPKPIKSFRDLHVYQNTYQACLIVHKELLPLIPAKEKYDLTDQLSRATKAVPRLIAEGYAKRHQSKGFQKYLDDAMAESNETIVCLEHCKDIYKLNASLCNDLIDLYDKSGRQLFKLSMAWTQFKSRNK